MITVSLIHALLVLHGLLNAASLPCLMLYGEGVGLTSRKVVLVDRRCTGCNGGPAITDITTILVPSMQPMAEEFLQVFEGADDCMKTAGYCLSKPL